MGEAGAGEASGSAVSRCGVSQVCSGFGGWCGAGVWEVVSSTEYRAANGELSQEAERECRPFLPRSSLGEEIIEGFHSREFVVFDVEDGIELGDIEDVVNFLGEGEKLEFAAGVADCGEATN